MLEEHLPPSAAIYKIQGCLLASSLIPMLIGITGVYLIAILASWGFCLFLTLGNLVPPDSAARLDKNETIAVINHASWFRVPYPGDELKFLSSNKPLF
uniref:Uncharacterized protein n=1 Tax=Parascaris equorum TaxID=6256 RepID=A0A914RJN5_PAREQ